ncbi:MAG: DsbA family protein [Arcobacter sp.]|nr:DsbA family protein [Arcobacter sp.]
MTHTLYYVYDPMCSWCYAFAPTFDEVKKKLNSNINIVYVPGGLAEHTEEIMPKRMQEQIESIWYEIEDVVGTKFNHDFWTQCTPKRSTYLACEATLAAKEQNKEEEMIYSIQNAYYQRAMNPSDKNTIIQLANELNLDIDLFKKTLSSEDNINNFAQKRDLRQKLNLNSFPSLALKYKKEIYPINIKYNDSQSIINQIHNLSENVYF